MRHLAPEHHEQRLALYRQGASDPEIARHAGVHRVAIRLWRVTHNLPTNRPDAVHLKADVRQERARQVLAAVPTREIAASQGVSAEAISRWWRKRGIKRPPRPKKARPAAKVFPPMRRHPTMIRIREAIGWGLAPDIVDEVVSEMMLAIIEGKLREDRIEAEVSRYVKAAFGMFASRYGPRSIDEVIGNDGFRLVDLIPDQSANAWLEEMGAVVG